jgi:hypothetical protein
MTNKIFLIALIIIAVLVIIVIAVSQSTPTPAISCGDGILVAEHDECENVTPQWCAEMGGEFNDCASACRHEPEGTICTMQCVAVCSFPNGQTVTGEPAPGKVGVAHFTSDMYGLSFDFPETFFITEKETGSAMSPIHSIILAPDTQENRDLFAGKLSDGREGSPTVTIDIYQNTENLTPQQWVEQRSNWLLKDRNPRMVTVAGEQALAYQWTGLYEGQSYIVSKNGRLYVFSASWLGENDETIPAFNTVTLSARFE